MNAWPPQPLIYEINAQVWLEELRQRHGDELDLGTIPSESWDAIAELGVDAVWLMGVWQRSPAGRAVAMQNEALMAEFQRALPDLEDDDILGSAYCVRQYIADEALGGPQALARARRELARRNMRLILDYVPNHVAPDHPWCVEHPEYFIPGTIEDLERDGSAFLKVGDHVMACGRDPSFSPWQDVVQVNAFHQGLREAAIVAATEIALQCDAMRCDMAMLVMNSIFARTWGRRAGDMPDEDYWPQVIRAVKAHCPDVRFIAEAYWDLEAALRPPEIRQRRKRPVAPAGRPDVPVEAGAIYRKPRRSAGGGGFSSRQASSRRDRRLDAARRPVASRRAIRGAHRPHTRIPAAPADGDGGRADRGILPRTARCRCRGAVPPGTMGTLLAERLGR